MLIVGSMITVRILTSEKPKDPNSPYLFDRTVDIANTDRSAPSGRGTVVSEFDD